MDKHIEERYDQIKHMKACEFDFVSELLEQGATWEKAISMLAEQTAKFGQPVKVSFFYDKHPDETQRKKEHFRYEWEV